MNKEYIEFKRERDLGSIISDAFKFIRLEGKQFFLSILKVAAIPIVVAVASMIYYMISMSSIITEDASAVIGMIGSVFIMMIAYLVAIVFINLAGMYYIKSYIDNKGVVIQEEVVANTKAKFWSFTGFGILAGLILFASAMLCVLPVFYTWPALSLGASILVFQNETASGAVGKCFNFISGYFWEVFGVVFVVSILVSVLGYVFQIPAMIYQFAKMGLSMGSDDPAEVFGFFSDPIYLILNVVSIAGQLMFYSITLITNVFLYFDVNEKKNLTGTIERIDSLGQ
ncbi:hypothetical protein C8N26_1811 [Tenacibaculum lutimaris]|uniref:Glycerophosphoryl diester phosphodiesterase family protein n=1 Tax=Tenacibaculum lutimaris TaxID=285258 RepID=A0A420DZY5_9FLAO|nr:hypothetical protein [Tenacibaculum lutimaris]RKF03426.1 hypothetical protein C8N26_1811 [Tenacibaculum lutimaris]